MSQHHTQGRQGQGSRRRSYNKSYNRRGGYHRMPRPEKTPVKLTFWQKILKAVGLYKPTAPKKRTTPKVNVRNARTDQQKERNNSYSRVPTKAPRLYIGNLSYEVTENDIQDLFKGFGRVRSVEIIYNPRTHKSKGYGFVEMCEMADATRCVEVLHGQPFMGREMMVSAANERQDRSEAEASQPVEEKKEPLVQQTSSSEENNA